MAFETIIVERRGAVDWVTLNRPRSLNALNHKMVEELRDYFGDLYTRDSTRIVVLKAAGKAFCAGHDMKGEGLEQIEAERESVGLGLAAQRRLADIIVRMRECPQPIIALIQGAACGGGLSLALAADIRIAGHSAKMNSAFIRIGLGGCDLGTSYFLPRIAGSSLAAELILTGRFIDAARAERLGLVSAAVPDAELEAAAAPFVEEMLATSPIALRLSKECLNYAQDAPSIYTALAMENRNQIICSQTDDFVEGSKAFVERRPPRFQDR
jgi:enoyl-CoA hydratase